MDKITGITVTSPACDTITLTWTPVSGATFYQVEVDGGEIAWTSTNTSTKSGLDPGTEHSFRVCYTRGSITGPWSDAVRGKTLSGSSSSWAWKEFPKDRVKYREHSVNEKNPRIATRTGMIYAIDFPHYDIMYSVVVGNKAFPPNTVTRLNIKILNSEENDGFNMFFGVEPADTDKHIKGERNGWYLDCYHSKLLSKAPEDYSYCSEDPEKEGRGNLRVGPGSVICLIMDTTKGSLSFTVNGASFNGTLEGIPLDKPLVPCVILGCTDDSIEIDPSMVPGPNERFGNNGSYDDRFGGGSAPGSGPGMGSGFGTGPGTDSRFGPGMGSGFGTGSGMGPGTNSGFGPGMGSGFGPGTGSGFGPASGPGMGSGFGPGMNSGFGPGMGSGFGPGTGSGFGPASGPGMGSGMGSGFGPGPGTGFGAGPGTGMGSGFGPGTGSGFGMGPGAGDTRFSQPSGSKQSRMVDRWKSDY